MEYEEGFYNLYSADEKEPSLVHGYKCADLNGAFVFGFNTHDGGGLIALSDLRSDSRAVRVSINEIK